MRNSHMSVLALSAAAAAVAALMLTASGASAAVNYNSSKSNTGNVTAQPAACPAGETAVLNPATGKQDCVAPSKTYNASHSNTANDGPCPTCAKCVNPKGCS
jgi:hypothetical protein